MVETQYCWRRSVQENDDTLTLLIPSQCSHRENCSLVLIQLVLARIPDAEPEALFCGYG